MKQLFLSLLISFFFCSNLSLGQQYINLSVDNDIPIGFGVLTCYNYDQAVIRSNVNKKNKGREAALACIELLK